MAKKKITEIVTELMADFLQQEGYELYNIEFIKEAKDWFLRVYIDKAISSENEYIGTEDCEKVSRYIGEILDEENIIEQNYYLEVSSPGMDRELILPEHFKRFKGNFVDLKLYKPIDGQKEITGILIDRDDDYISIEMEKQGILKLPIDSVAKTKLAVII